MAVKILHVKYKGETIDLGECDIDEMSALDAHNITKCKMTKKGNFLRFPTFYYCKPGQVRKKHWIMKDRDLLDYFTSWENELVIVINMVDNSEPSDLCKWALMLDRQQQKKLVEEIELNEPNPDVSEEGEDQGSDDAVDIMVVSPTQWKLSCKLLYSLDVLAINVTSKKGKEPVIEEDEGWDSDWTSSDSKDGDYVVRPEEECYESDTSLEAEQIQAEIVDYYVCGDDEDDKAINPN
ncbi:hypothetical protein Cgig2_009023 [Carnegiea gigantea]|uniref:Uncharacterized protein n=1 Tax=Carnegiea gigantea TaxID=171969 RepID=A0A9Q1QGY0_9CARY|nr:hypothetical protein Cgig2_009023 [Carnegiea gigantea]